MIEYDSEAAELAEPEPSPEDRNRHGLSRGVLLVQLDRVAVRAAQRQARANGYRAARAVGNARPDACRTADCDVHNYACAGHRHTDTHTYTDIGDRDQYATAIDHTDLRADGRSHTRAEGHPDQGSDASADVHTSAHQSMGLQWGYLQLRLPFELR